MRWSNKIIELKGDQSSSKISSRSMSKFKKINLQLDDHSTSQNLQKQQLKLSSIQKINSFHQKSSLISNYSKQNQNNSSHIQIRRQQINDEKEVNKYEKSKKQPQNLLNAPYGSKQYIKHHRTQSDLVKQKQFNKVNQQLKINSSIPQLSLKVIHQQGKLLSKQQKIQKVLFSLKLVLNQFRKICQIIKISMNKTIANSISQLNIKIQNYIKTQLDCFQHEMSKYMQPKQTSFQQYSQIKKRFHTQSDQKSHILANGITQHQPNLHPSTPSNRPSTFKNKFKQILTNNQPHKTRLQRKQTNPTHKSNLHKGQQHYDFSMNQLNQSNGSINYGDVMKNCSSRSVKKLQERITSLKKIFSKPLVQSNDINNILKDNN